MAIIESLSLTAGGGVVSTATQCKQIGDTVSLIIGLGGTGTDAIRAIKTQVNERLIPDNAAAYDAPNSNVSVREYNHIKFLSIDTDKRSSQAGKSGFDVLTNPEKMDLSLAGSVGVINTEHRPDLKWINDTNGQIAQVIARGDGAGGIRQAGRFLLFDKIDSLQAKIQQLVNEAKVGFTDNCRVVVHIFSGISGGTGSGTFLDVCYTVRAALKGTTNLTILGYFFMPDINLSRQGLDEASKKFIPENGYAALQELNYCMNIPDNGGKFKQQVKNGEIYWDCPPVNMCHLIGAATEKGAKITDDDYDYAMHTVTEYVLDFLSDNPNDDFSAFQLASNQFRRIGTASMSRTGGYNPCMVSIGAACASIPYKEINTYLISGMFEAYRKTHNETVTQVDADKAIDKAWNVASNTYNTLTEKIYASLLQMLSGNEEKGFQGYDFYQDPDGAGRPWKYLLETFDSNFANDLETYYQTELNKHIGNLEENANRLISESINGVVNRDSLIFRLEQELDFIVKDINRGPKFAKNIIDHVEGANVLNLLAGLKARNNAEFQTQEKEIQRRYDDYKATQEIFFNRVRQGLTDNDRRRYEDFENSVIAYIQTIELVGGKYSNSPNARQMVGVYGHISRILDALETQIRERLSNYYAPICSVMDDLTDTFKANYEVLTDKSVESKKSGFNKPLISITDDKITSLLDQKIDELPMPDVFRDFMVALISAGYDVWQKKETRLPKTIQSFFVGTNEGKFSTIASTTVDDFLKQKYGLQGQHLEQAIIRDFVHDLMNASLPLLALNEHNMDNQKQYQQKVTFPSTSTVIDNALNSTDSGIKQGTIGQGWTLIKSSISDRLLFVQIRDGFPLQAYRICSDLENAYYRSKRSDATHLYEKNGIYKDMPYSNWNELPNVIVPSFMDPTSPVNANNVKALFDQAVERGIIKVNYPFNEGNEEDYSFIYKIDSSIQNEIDGILDAISSALDGDGSISSKLSKLVTLKSRVNALLDGGYKQLERTNLKLKLAPYKADTDEDSYDRKMKLDYLYNSPVYQLLVADAVNKLDENLKTLQSAVELIKQKEQDFSKYEAQIKERFLLAIHTGTIKINDDGSIVYEYDDDGYPVPYVLFTYEEDSEYQSIPYYEAFNAFIRLPESIQDNIFKMSNKVRMSDSARQYSAGLKAGILSDSRINVLRGKAKDQYPEAVEKISRFLVDLKNYEF